MVLSTSSPISGDATELFVFSDVGSKIILPSASLLFKGDYERDGPDLLVSMEGEQSVRVVDYFTHADAPTLYAADGTSLKGSIVESLAGPLAPGQYAQSGATATDGAIGQVEELSGTATVQRADGTTESLEVGTKVFQNDVVQTADGSKVSLTFVDGTIFTLASASRMILDELIYDPNSSENSGIFNLVEGSFVFIAGQAAKTGGLEINTPAATMGIRGTTVRVDIVTVDGKTTVEVSLNRDPNGETGIFTLSDLDGNEIATIDSTDSKWIVSPVAGETREIDRSSTDFDSDQVLITDAVNAFQAATQRVQQGGNFVENNGPTEQQDGNEGEQEAAPEDSGQEAAPDSDAPSDAPTDTQQETGGEEQDQSQLDSSGIETELASFDGGDLDSSGDIPGLESGDTNAGGLDGGVTGASQAGSSQDDSEDMAFEGNIETGELPIETVDDSFTINLPTLTTSVAEDGSIGIAGFSINGPAGGTAVVTLVAGSTVTLAPGSGVTILVGTGTNDVTVQFVGTFDQINAALNGDGTGPSLVYAPSPDEDDFGTLDVTAEFDGQTVSSQLVIDIVPQQDAPTALDDALNIGEDAALAVGNLLDNDSDPDTTPTPDVLTVTSANVGGTAITLGVAATLAGGGSLVVNANGSYSFDLGSDFNDLAAGDTAVQTVNYQITDGNGNFDDAVLTITVTGADDAPSISVANFTNVLEGDAGTVSLESFQPSSVLTGSDPDDGEIPTVVNGSLSLAVGATSDFTTTANFTVNATDVEVDTATFDSLAEGEQGLFELSFDVASGPVTSTQTTLITINGLNDAPVASAQAITTNEDVAATGQLVASDVDGDAFTFSAVGTPANGSVVVNADGSFTYTPDADFNGADSFDFIVDDGNGGTAIETVTVTINAVNDVPSNIDEDVLSGTITEGIGLDESVTFLAVAFDDPDGDVPTFTLNPLSTNPTAPFTINFTQDFMPDPSRPRIEIDATILNSELDQLAQDETLSFDFTLTIDDVNGGIVTVGDAGSPFTLNVVGTNDAPVITGLASDILVQESVALGLEFGSLVDVSDVDGDPLILTLSVDNGELLNLLDGSTIGAGVIETQVDSTTVTLEGSAADLTTYLRTFDSVQFQGPDFVNGDNFAVLTINANDGVVNPVVGTANIDITAVNDGPEQTNIPSSFDGIEDNLLDVDLSGATFSDIDGDPLQITLTTDFGAFLVPTDGASVGAGVVATLVDPTTVTVVGAQADINLYFDTASNVQLAPVDDAFGEGLGNVTVIVSDLDSAGQILSNQGGDMIAINLAAANDAPVAVADTNAADAVVESGVDPVVSLAQTFDNPTPANGDLFGFSVDVSGNFVLIGNLAVSGTGQVELFDATTGNLLQTFDNPTPALDDQFGSSVAIDGNFALIGARRDDAFGTNNGQAHLFDATTGNLLQTFDNPSPAAFDNFADAVAVDGNFVLISAPNDDSTANGSGQVYLFDATTGNLLRTFDNPTPAFGDQFGNAIAIDGNLILINAPNDDTGATESGQAYLFDANTGALLQTFENPSPETNDLFGSSLAIDGDFVLIGALNDNTNGTDSGQAYLFDAATGALLQTFNNPSPENSDNFGEFVAIDGNNVLIGAPFVDDLGSNVGQAFLFDAVTGTLLQTFDDPTITTGDNFGSSVALDGDNVVIGADFDDSDGTDAGQAHLFDLGSVTFPDASAAGNVLANDTDVDAGDTLTVVGVAAGDVSGVEQSGNVASTIVGTFGSIIIAADGSYTYTLDNADADTQALADGEIGTDVFTYTLEDAVGARSTTTLTISVNGVNDAPTQTGLPTDVTVADGTESNVDLSGFTLADVDSADHIVTITVDIGVFTSVADGGSDLTVNLSTANFQTISLIGTPANINTYLSNPENITYTGPAGVTGDNQATITVFANDGDGSGAVELGTVNVDIVANSSPTITSVPSDITLAEDTLSDLNLSTVEFTDLDGDELTLTLSVDNGTFAAPSAAAATAAGVTTSIDLLMSTITIVGDAANIETFLDTASNIQYQGALNANGDNAALLTLDVTDGNSAAVTDTINIDISAVNDPPTVVSVPADIPDVSVIENTASNVDLSSVTFADVDGDQLTVTLTVNIGEFEAPAMGLGVTVTQIDAATITIVGSAADITTYFDTASNIQYTGPVGVSGDNAAALSINVNDGTVDVPAGPVNIDIQAPNEAPSFNLDGLTASEFITNGDFETLNGTFSTGENPVGVGANGIDGFTVSNASVSVVVGGDLDASNGGDNAVRLELAGSGTSPGTISQTIETIVGRTYEITITSTEPATTTNGVNAFLFVDNATNDSVTFGGGQFSPVTDTLRFVASSTTTTVSVAAQGSGSNNGGRIIDDLTVAEVRPDNTFVAQEGASTSLEGIVVADDSVSSSTFSVTLTVTSGTLTDNNGSSPLTITGSGTNTLVLTGLLADINSELDGGFVTYDGPVGFRGLDTLTITADDGDTAGVGGAQSFTQTVDVVVGNADSIFVGTEGGDTTVSDNLDNIIFSFDGVDVGNFFDGNDVYIGGADVDNVDGQVGDDFLFGAGGNDVLVGFSGNDTLLGGEGDDILVDLAGEAGTYDGGAGQDTFFVSNAGAIDLTATPNSAFTSIETINLSNSGTVATANVLTLDETDIFDLSETSNTVVEGLLGGASLPDSILIIADAIDTVNFDLAMSGSFSFNLGTATSGFNIVEVEDNGGTTVATVAVSNAATLVVEGFNNAPVVTTGAVTTAFLESDPPVVVNNTIEVSDVDGDMITGATVSISLQSGVFEAGDTLIFTDTASITGFYDDTTGVLTLTGTDTAANYQAALRSITFQSDRQDLNDLLRDVDFVVNDGTVDSAVATSVINPTSINNAPSIDTSGVRGEEILANGGFETPDIGTGSTTVLSGGTAITGFTVGDGANAVVGQGSVDILGGGLINAADGSQAIDLDGDMPGSITTTLVTEIGATYEVNFQYAGNPTGGGVRQANVIVGNQTQSISFDTTGLTFNTLVYQTQTIVFTATETATDLTFQSLSDATSSTGIIIDDVSVREIASTGTSVEVGGSFTFSDLVFADPDSGTNNVAVTLAVTNGTLTLGAGSTAGISVGGDGTGTLTLGGALSAINDFFEDDDALTYLNTSGVDGDVDNLNITVEDFGNSGSGFAQSASTSIVISLGTEEFMGGAGNDTFAGGPDAEIFDGGIAGADSVLGNGGNDFILGSAGSLADFLVGGDGDDFIAAGGSSDTLLGGAGDDTLQAFSSASGADLNGDGGNDRIFVDSSSSLDVDGGTGRDELRFFQSGSIDLGAIVSDINGIEALSLENGLANTLDFDLAALQGLSTETDTDLQALLDQALTTGRTILGDAVDTVDVEVDAGFTFTQNTALSTDLQDDNGNLLDVFEFVETSTGNVLATVAIEDQVTVVTS